MLPQWLCGGLKVIITRNDMLDPDEYIRVLCSIIVTLFFILALALSIIIAILIQKF